MWHLQLNRSPRQIARPIVRPPEDAMIVLPKGTVVADPQSAAPELAGCSFAKLGAAPNAIFRSRALLLRPRG